MRLSVVAVLVALVGVIACWMGAEQARAGSETPPEGPPWVRDVVLAQKQALERKVPIFVYLTKTH